MVEVRLANKDDFDFIYKLWCKNSKYMLSEDLYNKSKLKNGFVNKDIMYVDIKSLYEKKKEVKKVELF